MSETYVSTAPGTVARFWAKVRKTQECWEWVAYRNSDGYGVLRGDGRNVRAHRYAYELLVGPIPDGHHLDHLCRNRGCVNPAHLEPVTSDENTRRGEAGRHNPKKTACCHGHPYTPENTYWKRSGWRECRTCRTETSRRSRAKRKADDD